MEPGSGARPKVVAIVGPTGTGKTEIAAEVARRTGAEIIGADSMQVYRGLDIGTAKPSAELRAEVPHHAVDVVAPDDPMSAGRYARLAREAAREIAGRSRPVVLCGGTGLYARAFAGGMVSGVASDPQVRARIETRSTDELRAELEARDPAAATRIHAHDRVRTVRALEALELSGRPLSAQHGEHGFGDRPFDVVWLGLDLPRTELWRRISDRVERMFAAGLVEEVRGLYGAGYGPELPSLRAIGYRQVGCLLAGRMRESEARESIALDTRRYARRQRTWFRAEPGLRWLDAANREATVEAALAAFSPR